MVRFIHPKRGSKKTPRPVNSIIGEVFDAEVTALGGQGQALVTHANGQKVFIHGAWPGEVIKVKVFAHKNNTSFAHLLEVIEPHPKRIEPSCAHHGTKPNNCGGCPWMFMDYPSQLEAKQERIEQVFTKLHKTIQPGALKTIVPSDPSLHYRIRAQFKTDGEVLGFVQTGSHQLVDIEQCEVLNPANQQHLNTLRAQLPNPNWQAKKANTWTTLDVDENNQEASVNRRLPFQQANASQNARMHQWLSDKLATLNPEHTALELFCGSGNFTEVIANRGFKQCIAIEGVAEATALLTQKNLTNVQVITCDLFSENKLQNLITQVKHARIVILDPPRDGFKLMPQLLQALKQVEHIFYISCDIATLCRDIKPLLDKRFKLTEVQPVDVFPQTSHIETLVHLSCTTKNKGAP